MNDDVQSDKQTEESAEAGPRGGERLREAREAQQIALLEIAKELHLDEYKVRALEQNDFEVLGAPVFAKGHLRKYAELVDVDERDILGDYHELTRAAGMPPVVGTRRKPGSELSPGPWIAVVLILLALAFAYWWFTSGNAGSTVPAPAATSEIGSGSSGGAAAPDREGVTLPPVANDVPEDSAPEPAGSLAPEVAAGDVGGAVAGSESDASPADTDATATAAVVPVIDSERVVLSLSFGEDCWTEVSDATGRRLFFGLGRAGTNIEVDGEPPLSVLLGSADQVEVRVNGGDYQIRPEQRRGRTARLSLP